LRDLAQRDLHGTEPVRGLHLAAFRRRRRVQLVFVSLLEELRDDRARQRLAPRFFLSRSSSAFRSSSGALAGCCVSSASVPEKVGYGGSNPPAPTKGVA